jgi:hypothetical protein
VNAAFEQPLARQPIDRSDGYVEDLIQMNQAAGWDADCAQQPAVRAKFFGGNPRSLEPHYVLMVSLNHRLETKPSARRASEYQALNNHGMHFDTCKFFFSRRAAVAQPPHYHPTFFNKRADVLAGYLEAAGFAVTQDPFERLERHSLYVERYPTWSPNSSPPANPLRGPYCVELNDRVLALTLELLPPAAILLAGTTAWNVLDDESLGTVDPWQCWDVPKVTRDGVPRTFHASRTEFLPIDGATPYCPKVDRCRL